MRLKNVLFGVAGAVLTAAFLFGTSTTSLAAVQDHMGSNLVEVQNTISVYAGSGSTSNDLISRTENNAYIESSNGEVRDIRTDIHFFGQTYDCLVGPTDNPSPNPFPTGNYRIGINLPINVLIGPGTSCGFPSGDFSLYNGNELVVSIDNSGLAVFPIIGLLPMPEEIMPEITPEQAYNVAVDNSKKEIANCDATSEVYFQGGGTIDDSVIASVASNPDATFLYSFPYNDELITLKITSEAAAACFDPEIKYYGPEWLMAHFPQVENEYIPN